MGLLPSPIIPKETNVKDLPLKGKVQTDGVCDYFGT